MNKKILQSEHPRYMTSHLKAQVALKEEEEVREQMAKVHQEMIPDYRNVKHKYLKGLGSHQVQNYKKMISKIMEKNCDNQR